jgi:hypothetical protein
MAAFELLSTGALIAIATLLLKSWLEARRVKIDENASSRTTYEHLVSLLTADLQAVRAQHEACDRRIAELQREHLHLQRQIMALTLRYAIPLDNVPPAIASALASLSEIVKPPFEEDVQP